MVSFIKKLIKEYESFSIEGQNAIFYHFFATVLACIIMIVSSIKESMMFQLALAYIPIVSIIAFSYYNSRILRISLYLKVNHPIEYNAYPSYNLLGFGRLKIINPVSIKEPLLNSIRDTSMQLLIREVTFYRRLLFYGFLVFFLFYTVFGTLWGLAINSH